MKKFICMILFMVILSTTVFANVEATFEEISEDDPSLLQKVIFDENRKRKWFNESARFAERGASEQSKLYLDGGVLLCTGFQYGWGMAQS